MNQLSWKKEAIDHLVELRFPAFTVEVREAIRETKAELGCDDTSDEILDRVWKLVRKSGTFGVGELNEAQQAEEMAADKRMRDRRGLLTAFGRERLREYLDQALNYLNELDDLSFDNRQVLYDAYEKDLSRKAAETQAFLEERDKGLFFNGPEAAANFADFGEMIYWTADQAVAFWVPGSPFVARYYQRLGMIKQAVALGELQDAVRPTVFIDWANKVGIELPEELYRIFRIESTSTLQAKLAAATREGENLREQIAEIRQELATKESEHLKRIADLQTKLDGYEKDFTKENAKSVQSVMKLVLGMAIARYEHHTGNNSEAPTSIAEDLLTNVEIRIHRETVLEWLREAAHKLEGFTWEKDKVIRWRGIRKPKAGSGRQILSGRSGGEGVP